jgi:hypothetical protein
MKVFSILILGLALIGILAADLAPAQDQFTIIKNNIRKTCVVDLIKEGTTGVRFIDRVCNENRPTDEEVIDACGYYGDVPDGFYDVYELIRNGDGFLIRHVEFEYDGNSWDVNKVVEVPIPPPTTPWTFQCTAPPNSSSQTTAAAAAANRLFTAGPKNSAAANDYLSYALSSSGQPTGAKSTVFTNPNTKAALGASVSHDGSFSVQLSATSGSWSLSTRKLKNGVPAGAPSSWTIPAYSGYSPDITNAIEVNSGAAGQAAQKIRYLVYREFRNVGTTSQQSRIVIQTIDDLTGKPVGAAKPLTQFKNAFQATAEAIQSLAIAPNGGMLVFTEYSGACKKQILKAVNLNGDIASGPAKTIAGCAGLVTTPAGYLGIDISITPQSSSSPSTQK